MVVKYVIAGALALGLLGFGAAFAPGVAIHPAYAACDPGTRVDGTTAESTTRLLRKSGYSDIQIEQKGCDSVWHVIATKDGQRGRFAVEPGGRIYPEGN